MFHARSTRCENCNYRISKRKREKNNTLQEIVHKTTGTGDSHWGIPKPRKKPIEIPNEHASALHHQSLCIKIVELSICSFETSEL